MIESLNAAHSSERARFFAPPAAGGFTRQTACGFAAAWLILAVALPACNQPPAVNPWRDDSIPADTWSTPSRDGILAAGHEPVIRQREMTEVNAPHVSRDVPHYPLWWEDPLEDKGDQNDRFAWTWQDYIAMPYSFGRFLLNTMAWPVSAVVTPPGTPMVSDGKVGRDHDAALGSSADPTATGGDFGYPECEPPLVVSESARDSAPTP